MPITEQQFQAMDKTTAELYKIIGAMGVKQARIRTSAVEQAHALETQRTAPDEYFLMLLNREYRLLQARFPSIAKNLREKNRTPTESRPDTDPLSRTLSTSDEI